MSVVVNYDSYTGYTMSMTADDSYHTCAPFVVEDLKMMLLGSRQMWYRTGQCST